MTVSISSAYNLTNFGLGLRIGLDLSIPATSFDFWLPNREERP